MNAQQRQDCADFSRAMAIVRNMALEDIHAGKAPISKTGDFSDVVVVDAGGRRIP